MDPYLEHPALWPDVHDRLSATLADDLSERVALRYYAGVERRTYLLKADDLAFMGRPDLAVAPTFDIQALAPQQAAPTVLVLEVDVPVPAVRAKGQQAADTCDGEGRFVRGTLVVVRNVNI
jgi:hypothetical protein